MSDKSKSKKDEPKTVTLTVSKAADFKGKKRTGMTVREFRQLSEKDRLALSPKERERLTKAQEQHNEQLIKMARSLTNQYDFSAMTKLAQAYTVPPIAQQSLARTLAVVDTSPIMKMVAEMQTVSLAAQPSLNRALGIQTTIAPAIDAIYKSTLFTQNQFTALTAIQKSLDIAYPTGGILTAIKGIQDAFQAPFIARTMFADFHTAHERILRNLRFDIGSLTASIEFSRFETVDFAVDDVTTDDDSLTATAVATQTNTVGNITLTSTTGFQLIVDKLDANQQGIADNQREIAELKRQFLSQNNEQGKLLFEPSEVRTKNIGSSIQIQLGTLKVNVRLSSGYTRLARFLLSSPDNMMAKWDIEDLAREVFGAHFANASDEEEWKSKIKGYAHHFNQQVMIASSGKILKFIDNDKKSTEYFVNQDYLNL